jgi:hypothetical protein
MLPPIGPLERNIFEYAREAAILPEPVAPASEPEPPEASSTKEPSAVRLVGLVGSGKAMKVALAIDGQVAVLGPGEAELGYRIVSVDESAGIRILGPDGESVLPIP